MTAGAPDPAPVSARLGGVARAHRGLALLFLALGVVAFFLAGLAVFGDDQDFEPHQAIGSTMLLLSLILLVLAIAGRREAVQASAVLFGLMILQMVLAQAGEDVALLGALHPVNGLAVLGVASIAAAGRRLWGSRGA